MDDGIYIITVPEAGETAEWKDSGMFYLSEAAQNTQPKAYSGKYYTPLYGDENFYTPWGKSSLDTSFSYLKLSVWAIVAVSALIFVMPYAIRALMTLLREIKKVIR